MHPDHYENRRLRTEEAARYCGSSKSTFEKMRVHGNGPVYSKLGRVVVYAIPDLEQWLDSRRRRSTSDRG